MNPATTAEPLAEKIPARARARRGGASGGIGGAEGAARWSTGRVSAVQWLALVLPVGIALRLYVAAALDGKAFNDTAIVGLMAMHELAGRFYAFYWGQSYMGSTESLSIAPFFALLGVNEFTLCLGLLPWFVLFTIAIYAVTDLCAGRRAAFLAALLSAIAPAYLEYHEMMPLGGYPETLALGTVLVLLTLRLVYRPLGERARTFHWIAIGAVAGFAFWTNWLVLPYFVVCALYLVLLDPALWRRRAPWLAALSFFAGSAPFWIYNVQHGFGTFHLLEREAAVVSNQGRGSDLYWVLTLGLPNVLGIRELTGEFSYGAVGIALGALLLVAFAIGLVALRRSWGQILRGRVAQASPVAALYVFAIVMAIVYTECRPTTLRLERYLVPFATATIPLSAIALAWLFGRARKSALLLLALGLALYGREVVDLHRHFVEAPARFFAGPVERLAAYLESTPIRFAYADYGDAMITTFLTRDRVVVTDYQNRRYPIDEEPAADPAVVLHDDPGATAATTLASLDADFKLARIPGYLVYWPIRYDGLRRAPLPRDGWKVSATISKDDAALVLDDDLKTAWLVPAGAADAALTVDLGAAHDVNGLYLHLGGHPELAFHEIRVESSDDGDRWQLAKQARWDFPVTLRSDGRVAILPDDVQVVLFPPRVARFLRVTLTAPFPGHAWAIAELAVFTNASEGPMYRVPTFADPDSFALAERRLKRDADRQRETDRPLIALRELYRKNGQSEEVAAIDRTLRERFSPATPLTWRFDDSLELRGYDRKDLGPREVEVTLYWKALGRIESDVAASLHVVGDGPRFQADSLLGEPSHPTAGWVRGETFKQVERLKIPANDPPGRYVAKLGVWSPSERRHLQAGPWWHRTKQIDLLRIDVPAGG